MTPIEIGLISVIAIVVLIYLGVYIPVALGMVSFVAVWLMRDNFQLATNLLRVSISGGAMKYEFATIPLFTFMGLIVSKAGLGADIYDVMNRGFRRLRGGVGMGTVGANAVFAAVTGSSIASASVFSKISVPEMLRLNYNPRFAVGVVAGSSVLGMIIPPSAMLIIYSIVAEVSVGDMFLAGVIPGIMLAVAYVVTIFVMGSLTPNFVGGRPPEGEEYLTSGQVLAKVIPVLAILGVIGWLAYTYRADLYVLVLAVRSNLDILRNVLIGLGLICLFTYVIALILGRTSIEQTKAYVRRMRHSNLADVASKTLPTLLIIVVVLGGIYTGWLTAVEAGAAGAIVALLVAIIRRTISLKGFWEALLETGHITAAILFLIIAAGFYSRMLGMAGLPNQLGDLLEQNQAGFVMIMVIYVLLMLFLGTLLDTASIILIVVPLFLPLIEALDLSLIWFGIITVVGAEIGLLTPPLGISCFVIKSTLNDDRISLKDVFMGAFPFAFVMLLVLIILIRFPILSLAIL